MIVGIHKKYGLKFQCFQNSFLAFSVQDVYKMVDSMDIYKSLNINIGTLMKNPEMLKFIPDHLKTEKMCKHAVKKLTYLLRYAPDRYKTQKMCDKAILGNSGALKSVPDCYKNQEMCNKAVDNYPHSLEFIPECYETQKNV